LLGESVTGACRSFKGAGPSKKCRELSARKAAMLTARTILAGERITRAA
jgi:hypothetical protein